MDSNKYLEDISEIKNMMSRSSRFISLSGLSGIMAGIYALIGAYLAHGIMTDAGRDYFSGRADVTGSDALRIDALYGIAIGVLVAAVVTGIILTIRKSRKSGEKIWDVSSKRLVLNFLIPLLAGGVFCLVLIQYGIVWLVAPATLIFYGLACVNASKYTLGDIRYMGIAFIVLGLINTQFIGYGLYFWALGFGVFHILYGAIMHFKYDKTSS
ncbi:hypothetical protein FK220_002240 [Flavobacteriaceae bacterium TP-CH-4]|uniref:Uncharacterized protein n=1 Tax=Pelagihabitans pacificus TaxID=2696054 RepID=A0A967ECC9_9FLAO|nr:hypothetical protein [Pelagihabitans pacificus]NHF58143.1 hypothetical protein [Pelagihabitans pacificus]